MKLKFRADAKDIAIFIIFALFLLYFVSIGVLNIGNFAKNNTLHGFNPFPAFSPEYLAPTMVFYLLSLIAIITSVSSYFFDREKGFGVVTDPKTDKGYSRWAKDKEMKSLLSMVTPNSKTAEAAGVPMINDGKEIWVDNGEYHNLIIGSTGSGKTQIVVHPLVKLLAKKGESMIVTDPKGEIYEENVELLRQKGYNIVLLNFRDPQRGNAWNPLSLPYSLYQGDNQDKANELLDDLAMNILYDEKSQNQDPFWERTSADYFAGLSLALFEDAKEEEINLNSINLMTTVGEEKYLGNTYIKEYFSDKNQASPAYINVASTLMAPSDTKSSILSVFKQKIKLFSSRENLSEMLSHNDFDMKDIGRQKTAVFIVIQDEKKTYHSLVTIFIKQCYETLIDVAQENGGKLPFRTNFILDEFANMPPLKDVTTMVTAARSRNIRFNFIIQNFAQLYQVYGKENGETIKGNCGNIIYLISSELSALEEISKMCGEVKSKEKDKTASTPLVTVSDLQRLKQWETIILRTRMMPFRTRLTPNYKMNWGETFPKGTYPSREKQPIAIFDLKKYVDNKRNAKFESANDILNDGKEKESLFNPTNLFNQGKEANDGLNMDDLIKRIDAKIAELEEEERREKGEAMVKPDAVINNLDEEKQNNIVGLNEEIKNNDEIISNPFNNNDIIDTKFDNISFINDNIKSETIEEPIIEQPVEEIVSDRTIEPVIEVVPIEKIEQPIQTMDKTPKIEKNVENISSHNNTKYVTDDQFFDDFFSDDEE
jgi:type IV secretion system protein VirD4